MLLPHSQRAMFNILIKTQDSLNFIYIKYLG